MAGVRQLQALIVTPAFAYRFLDNLYLKSVVETGFVGLSLLLVIGIGIALGRAAWRRQSATRDLGQLLAASLVAMLVSFAPDDALVPDNLCLPVRDPDPGLCRAMWRFSVQERTAPAGHAR